MRPSITRTMIEIAFVLSRRSTCSRRQVGCVLVNDKNHIIGTGFNGVAKGETHCTDYACPGIRFASGDGLDQCEAIHAEANALLQCKDVYDIHTAYCTVSPCIHCVKLLMNTSCQIIWFAEEYPHEEAANLWHPKPWNQVDKDWIKIPRPPGITNCIV